MGTCVESKAEMTGPKVNCGVEIRCNLTSHLDFIKFIASLKVRTALTDPR